MRVAATQIRATEAMINEQHDLRFKPSVEVRLATLLSKKQLKPADLLAKMDTDKNGTVDRHEFANGLTALGMDATPEELVGLHSRLDLDTSGELDLNEIKAVVLGVHATKEKQKEREKKLGKDVLKAEQESKEMIAKVRAQLVEDQKKKEQVEAEAAQAARDQQLAQEAAAEAAKKKQQAKAQWELLKKAEFEKRIKERRKSQK